MDAMKKTNRAKYSRVLLKLSGEALGGPGGAGISPEAVHDMAEQIREVRELGVQVVVVVGGGNIFQRLAGSARGIESAKGHYLGVVGTGLTGLALWGTLVQ